MKLNARKVFKMLQNLHTHTNFCDGKNTPEEMIEAAINLGLDSLGFSGHCPTVCNTDWEMHDHSGYAKKIAELKEKYAGKIDVYLGTELDYYASTEAFDIKYDYTIGSVHMLQINGSLIDFDHSAEKTEKHIQQDFGGDSLAYARAYFDLVADLPNKLNFDIAGHFDLVTKFSEKHANLIDVDAKAYKSIALEALYAVREKQELFEVNTGAIAKGLRKKPYPAPFILKEMKALKCKLVLTSDCHNKNALCCHFNEAREYIKACGFDTLYFLGKGGFFGEKL